MKIIREMQESRQVVHVLSTKQAAPLLSAGYVRRASIDPAPAKGVAVNLTTKGRSYGRSRDATQATATTDDLA